jgi:hypothetical protein
MKSAESFMDAAKHTTLLQVHYVPPLPRLLQFAIVFYRVCAALGPGVCLVKEC